MSLDGYIADRDGNFDWAEPDEQVHTFVNDLERSTGTYLYGRRMYEVMSAWEHMPLDDSPAHIRDFATVWRAADKVVYSSSLDKVSTARTRLEPVFDADDVRRRKREARQDLSVGGPALAAHAFAAGLVDECHLFVAPISVGGGTRCLPADVVLRLALLEERLFRNGTVYLHYRVTPPA